MPSSRWCHSLCAASCSLVLIPAHSQPIWTLNECWHNYAAFITGTACVRTLMHGVGNVMDVPLAGGRQVDLMATFARSPPVHQWTSSPLTSCLAYLHSGRLQVPLTISPNGSRQYPCATQRHKRACVHYIAPSSAASACLASCIATRAATFRVSWWQRSARLRVLTKHGPRRFALGLMARPSARIGRSYRCSAPQSMRSPSHSQIACPHSWRHIV